jgi:parvulin-like peptidyl-prolyl isomerase
MTAAWRSVPAAWLACVSLLGATPAFAQTAPKQPAQRPATAQASADGDIVARVGSRDVTVGEVRAFVSALPPRDRALASTDPAALAQLVRAYLVNEVVLNAALAKKWEQRPDVAARLERARRETIIDTYLETASQPPADYPSDAEIQSLYEANTSAFIMPRQFQIAQIFVAVPAGGDDKAKARLDAIMARVGKAGADFMDAARIETEGKEAGDRVDAIGWVAEAQLKPEIREAVAGLAKGAVSAPLKLEDGWHVLKLVDTKAAGVRPLADVREQLATKLRQERATQLRRTVVQDLVRVSPAAINELALNKMAPRPAEGATR